MSLAERMLDLLINIVFYFLPAPTPSADVLHSTRLVAHRGVHEDGLARENSRRAFELAVENKIWAIELDVRFTKDHIPVIQHDADAERLFNRPDIRVADVSFQQLRTELPEILTLEEVISQFGRKTHLMIEIKDGPLHHNANKKRLLEQLQRLTPGTDYHLLSLKPQEIEPVADVVPKSAMMDVIWLDAQDIFQSNEQLGHGAISGHFLFFNTQKRKQLRESGKQFGTGFIQSRAVLYRELNKGVDFVFTNHPLTLKRFLQE